MLVAAATPEPIAQLLEREVRAAIQAPALAEKFRPQDMVLVGTSGAEAAARIKADTELWAGIVKAAGMKAE
jgi:tripartite-type tricarboxylate transporter receptor subunit TctC